jgi:hypothetical protein
MLTGEDIARLHDVDQGEKGPSLNDIARVYGMSRSCVQKRYKKYHAESKAQPADERDAVEVMQGKLKSQAQATETVKVIKAAAKERNFREFLSDELLDLVPRSVVPVPPEFGVIPNGSSVEAVVFQLSDWHLDEIVKPESVLGLNVYNQDVALKRVYDLLRRCFNIIERLERGGGWFFNEAVVSVNGDMITGAIHGLEKHTITGNVVLNSWLCAQALRDFILVVARRFRKVRVVFTPGNHTRFENEKSYNDPLRTWDTVIGMMVKEALADQENVAISIPDSYLATFEVQGWNFLQTHGEELASQFGVGVERLQSRLTQLQDVNYFLLGHWHQAAEYPALQGSVYFNGSLIGANAYSLGKLGKATPPSQNLLFVKASKGVTAPWQIKPDVFPGPEALTLGPYNWSS